MANDLVLRRSWRDYRHLAAAGLALGVIIAWLLFGSTGLFAWSDYTTALNNRRVQLAELQREQARLQNHQRLLDPRHVDPDLSEEMVREELNLLHPDDIVVPLK